MSQQPRKKRVGKVAMVEETIPVASGEPMGDHRGYLATGLAMAVVAIVGVIVVMVILAAT
jgi:hypothetical protein